MTVGEADAAGPAAADRYLTAVVAAGVVALAVAAVLAAADLTDPMVLLLAAAFAVTAPTPLVNRRQGDTMSLTVEEVFLVPAFVLLSPAVVVVATTVGVGTGLLVGTRWPAPWVRRTFFVPQRVAFNVACRALATGLAAAGVHLLAPRGAGIGVAILGAGVFAVTSWLLVAGIIGLVSERGLGAVVTEGASTFVLVTSVVTAAGVLLAVAVLYLPAPAAWVGLAALLVLVSSALSNRALHRSDRIAALLDAAAAISQAGADVARVTAALEASARRLLDCREARVTSSPPGPGELAVELVPGTWLTVAAPRTSYVRSFEADAPRLLGTLGTIAAPALDRALAMTDLRSADDLKAAVLASVSHDVRTPLAIAAGTAEVLFDHPDLPLERRQHLLGNLRGSIDRLRNLVEGLLDLERYELGRLPEPADAEVGAAVWRVVEATSDACPCPLVVDGAPVRVRIDAPALERVVDNLISNAVKHGAAGEPVTVTFGPHRDVVRLTVEDTGPGVAPERRLEIFEPFRHDGRPGAVGLGLWVARRFVELRGGRIWVDEGDRGGAAFHVELPPAERGVSGRSGPAAG